MPDPTGFFWLREVDLNHRPSGYEPDELPGCSIPRKTGRASIAHAVSSNRGLAWEAAEGGQTSKILGKLGTCRVRVVERGGAMNETPPRKAASRAAEGLRTVSDEVLAEARRQIDESAENGATAVHEFRKAMKRWRAILRLYEPLLGE